MSAAETERPDPEFLEGQDVQFTNGTSVWRVSHRIWFAKQAEWHYHLDGVTSRGRRYDVPEHRLVSAALRRMARRSHGSNCECSGDCLPAGY